MIKLVFTCSPHIAADCLGGPSLAGLLERSAWCVLSAARNQGHSSMLAHLPGTVVPNVWPSSLLKMHMAGWGPRTSRGQSQGMGWASAALTNFPSKTAVQSDVRNPGWELHVHE